MERQRHGRNEHVLILLYVQSSSESLTIFLVPLPSRHSAIAGTIPRSLAATAGLHIVLLSLQLPAMTRQQRELAAAFFVWIAGFFDV